MFSTNIPNTNTLRDREEYREELFENKAQTDDHKRRLGHGETSDSVLPTQMSFWLNMWDSVDAPYNESLTVGTVLDVLFENDFSPEAAEEAIEKALALSYVTVGESDPQEEPSSHRLPTRREAPISLTDPWERPDLYVSSFAIEAFSSTKKWEDIFADTYEGPTIPISDVFHVINRGEVVTYGTIFSENERLNQSRKKFITEALVAVGKTAGVLSVKDSSDTMKISITRNLVVGLFDHWDNKSTADPDPITENKNRIMNFCHGRYEGPHGYTRFGGLKLKNIIYQPADVDGDQYAFNRPTDDAGPEYRLTNFTDHESIVIYPEAGETPPEWDAATTVESFINNCCRVDPQTDSDDSYVEFDRVFTVFERWLTLNDLDVPAFAKTKATNMRKGKFGELIQSAFPVTKKQRRTGDGRARVMTPLELTDDATQLLESN